MERGNGDVNVAAASQVGILVVCPLDRAMCVPPYFIEQSSVEEISWKILLGRTFRVCFDWGLFTRVKYHGGKAP